MLVQRTRCGAFKVNTGSDSASYCRTNAVFFWRYHRSLMVLSDLLASSKTSSIKSVKSCQPPPFSNVSSGDPGAVIRSPCITKLSVSTDRNALVSANKSSITRSNLITALLRMYRARGSPTCRVSTIGSRTLFSLSCSCKPVCAFTFARIEQRSTKSLLLRLCVRSSGHSMSTGRCVSCFFYFVCSTISASSATCTTSEFLPQPVQLDKTIHQRQDYPYITRKWVPPEAVSNMTISNPPLILNGCGAPAEAVVEVVGLAGLSRTWIALNIAKLVKCNIGSD
jgi:hypothetical protein